MVKSKGKGLAIQAVIQEDNMSPSVRIRTRRSYRRLSAKNDIKSLRGGNEMSNVSLLEQRKIEARVLIPVIKAF